MNTRGVRLLIPVVLCGLVAVSAPALEWNPFDNLLGNRFSIRGRLPFSRHGGSERVYHIYSTSREAAVPVRILAVPDIPEPRQRRLVLRMARRYLLAVQPMTGQAVMAGDVLPEEEDWREKEMISSIVRAHRAMGRLDPAALSDYLTATDANLVLVIELPRYEQHWAGFAKETLVQMLATAYRADTGERLFRVSETVRGRNSHRGQMFEELEADLVDAMQSATRGKLADLETSTRPAKRPAPKLAVAR